MREAVTSSRHRENLLSFISFFLFPAQSAVCFSSFVCVSPVSILQNSLVCLAVTCVVLTGGDHPDDRTDRLQPTRRWHNRFIVRRYIQNKRVSVVFVYGRFPTSIAASIIPAIHDVPPTDGNQTTSSSVLLFTSAWQRNNKAGRIAWCETALNSGFDAILINGMSIVISRIV